MIRENDIDRLKFLREIAHRVQSLREQQHTQCGEIFAIQSLLADLMQAIRLFGELKEQWTERLPYDSLMTEEEWEEMASVIKKPCVDIGFYPTIPDEEGVHLHMDMESGEEQEIMVKFHFWQRPTTTLVSPEYFTRLARAMEELHAGGYAVEKEMVESVACYALETSFPGSAYVVYSDEARYMALCMALQSFQHALSALLVDIKELLSHPAKEKLEDFYNRLLADYEQKFKAKEQKKMWKKIRDASSREEKLEMLQVMKDECRRTFMESGFLTIKAGSFSSRKCQTEEERLQAAYDSFFYPEGLPNVKAVRKYVFFHKSEMKPAQVKAWFHYDLMLKIMAEETAYEAAGQKQEEAAEKDAGSLLADMGDALKSIYLPRCYALLAEGYDAAWVNDFVDALLKSKHGHALCADWAVDIKRPQVVAAMFGLLAEADALQGSNALIARTYKGTDDRTFAKYVGNGRNSDYAEWAREYRQA